MLTVCCTCIALANPRMYTCSSPNAPSQIQLANSLCSGYLELASEF